MTHYIVIGGGSAGCVLAARLTEDPAIRVTLVEAGGEDRHFLYRMPAGYLGLMKTGMGAWRYETVPQIGLGGRRMYAPRGKVLGGSSSINGLTFVRGNPGDFGQWAQSGNRGWSYDECLPYFRKLEAFAGGADEWRGGHGPLGVAAGPTFKDMSPIGKAWIAAARSAGYPINPDINAASQEGFGRTNATIADGKRQSASVAYLRPALDRPNLQVLTKALVTRILIRDGTAVGITYRRDGREQSLSTEGDIVLCGGAVNSPQLLQLSGVGPAALLNRHGIPVIADLPGVGENLQDHASVMLMQESTQPYTAFRHTKPLKSALAILRYLLRGNGPTTSSGLEVQAFVKSRPSIEWPDIQYHFPMLLFEDHGRRIIQREGFAALGNASRPRSRGRVTIASANPLTPPDIDPGYFTDPEDLRVTRAAIRIARNLIAQPAFDGFRGPEYAPTGDKTGDADLDDYIRETATSVYHFVGTCRMGSDPLAVVDDQLRVHGIGGLRVIDASVMPTIVSGNTNAATLMIAEKAADLMRGQASAAKPIYGGYA